MSYSKYRFKPLPEGRFGNWLNGKMIDYDMSMGDIAFQLRCTRQTISNYTNRRVKPTFMSVAALCWLFSDDANEIWKLVEADWGD